MYSFFLICVLRFKKIKIKRFKFYGYSGYFNYYINCDKGFYGFHYFL